ncbi:MAG: hypothetical protein K2L24_03545, partial [Opitutales bacterium]|nr:hypothetical protein [Opitutales bacterium]
FLDMKMALMGIGFVMGISLASSCVFGETSQKRLNEYSGEELKQALNEVMNRLTNAGYQPIPGTLQYKFDASRVGMSPESKPASPESGEDKSDKLSHDATFDNDSDQPGSTGNSTHSPVEIKESGLSEKKQTFIRCVQHMAKIGGVELSEDEQQLPIIKECLQIAQSGFAKRIPQDEFNQEIIVWMKGGSLHGIEFVRDETKVKIMPDGKVMIETTGSDEDDRWLDVLGVRAKFYEDYGSESGKADTSADSEISALSEKKKAFIRCVKYKVNPEGAALSELDKASPIVQKCLQILCNVEAKLENCYSFDRILPVIVRKDLGIEIFFWPDGTRVKVTPNGEETVERLDNSKEDDCWFDILDKDANDSGLSSFAQSLMSQYKNKHNTESKSKHDFESESKPANVVDGEFSELSEKKKAFIRCIQYKVGQEGVELSGAEMEAPIIKKCLQILRNVEQGRISREKLDSAISISIDNDKSLSIGFICDGTQVEVAPNGAVEIKKYDSHVNDDWFDILSSDETSGQSED